MKRRLSLIVSGFSILLTLVATPANPPVRYESFEPGGWPLADWDDPQPDTHWYFWGASYTAVKLDNDSPPLAKYRLTYPRLSHRAWQLVLPYWVIVIPSGVLPLVGATREVRRRRRSRRARGGLCLHCGYDLRASGGTCPACGTARPRAADDWTG